MNLQEKRLTDRIIAFEQRELNNLLPKVAEKNQIPIGYCPQDIFNKMLKNDKEYVVCFENYGNNDENIYITNYGKVFLLWTTVQAHANTCRNTITRYYDLKINSMNRQILDIIKIACKRTPTHYCGNGNGYSDPPITLIR